MLHAALKRCSQTHRGHQFGGQERVHRDSRLEVNITAWQSPHEAGFAVAQDLGYDWMTISAPGRAEVSSALSGYIELHNRLYFIRILVEVAGAIHSDLGFVLLRVE